MQRATTRPRDLVHQVRLVQRRLLAGKGGGGEANTTTTSERGGTQHAPHHHPARVIAPDPLSRSRRIATKNTHAERATTDTHKDMTTLLTPSPHPSGGGGGGGASGGGSTLSSRDTSKDSSIWERKNGGKRGRGEFIGRRLHDHHPAFSCSPPSLSPPACALGWPGARAASAVRRPRRPGRRAGSEGKGRQGREGGGRMIDLFTTCGATPPPLVSLCSSSLSYPRLGVQALGRHGRGAKCGGRGSVRCSPPPSALCTGSSRARAGRSNESARATASVRAVSPRDRNEDEGVSKLFRRPAHHPPLSLLSRRPLLPSPHSARLTAHVCLLPPSLLPSPADAHTLLSFFRTSPMAGGDRCLNRVATGAAVGGALGGSIGAGEGEGEGDRREEEGRGAGGDGPTPHPTPSTTPSNLPSPPPSLQAPSTAPTKPFATRSPASTSCATWARRRCRRPRCLVSFWGRAPCCTAAGGRAIDLRRGGRERISVCV